MGITYGSEFRTRYDAWLVAGFLPNSCSLSRPLGFHAPFRPSKKAGYYIRQPLPLSFSSLTASFLIIPAHGQKFGLYLNQGTLDKTSAPWVFLLTLYFAASDSCVSQGGPGFFSL